MRILKRLFGSGQQEEKPKATGYVWKQVSKTCPKCKGIFPIRQIDCPHCKGKPGHTNCRICQGSGVTEQRCTECDGVGAVEMDGSKYKYR